jgi:hypothetical protein
MLSKPDKTSTRFALQGGLRSLTESLLHKSEDEPEGLERLSQYSRRYLLLVGWALLCRRGRRPSAAICPSVYYMELDPLVQGTSFFVECIVQLLMRTRVPILPPHSGAP